MEIKRQFIKQGTLEEFADFYGFTITVKERRLPIGHSRRFYAYFEHCDILSGVLIIGAFGDGATEEEAISKYAKNISLKRIVYDAYGENRKEIDVWRIL